MTQTELARWIRSLMEQDKLYKFYKSKEWTTLRDRILREAHYECQWCKERGKITPAETVHHVQFVKSHPEQALSEYYTHKGQRFKNLIPLCHDCHDMAHDRMAHKKIQQFNQERW